MKKALKIVAIVFVVGFVVIQFIRPDLTNPPINQTDTLETNLQVPENVQVILSRSCKDCHSNETKYPLYSKIQPSAWFMKNHIDEGRAQLNFSDWKNLPPTRQKRKLSQICEQVQSKEMPLPSYLWIHWDAKMSDEDIKTLCDWTEAEKAKLVETK
ncbi:MAG: heme-binding domain-containing protein [Actinomycetota bacterium]